MTFRRPFNITLTQMAQWVDTNMYTVGKDDNKLVEYVYHLAYNKAERLCFFNDKDTYNEFALFCVSKFLIRLANKTEPPVKSVVNYLKTVIDPWRSEYIREFCYGAPELNTTDFNVSDFGDYLVDVASNEEYNSFTFFSLDLHYIFKNHLIKIPRRKHSPEWSNIYVSCLLTLQDRIKTAANLCTKAALEQDPQSVNRIIRELKRKPPILFHIEEERSTYISVLVNELMHALAAELTYTLQSKVTVSGCLRNLVKAASNEEEDA